MGVGDLSVPKRMTTLYRSFAGRIAAYREASGKGREALKAAIARNVFPDGPAETHALALAVYLDTAVAALRSASTEDLRRGELPFPPIAPPQAEGTSA
jgi:cytochrome b pre-mRNA-processing protein 3